VAVLEATYKERGTRKYKRKTKVLQFQRPEGTLTPNEIGKRLNISGEAVKQWIYLGRLPAAKLDNGYWFVKEDDLKVFLSRKNNVEFKRHIAGPAKSETVELAFNRWLRENNITLNQQQFAFALRVYKAGWEKVGVFNGDGSDSAQRVDVSETQP